MAEGISSPRFAHLNRRGPADLELEFKSAERLARNGSISFVTVTRIANRPGTARLPLILRFLFSLLFRDMIRTCDCWITATQLCDNMNETPCVHNVSIEIFIANNSFILFITNYGSI